MQLEITNNKLNVNNNFIPLTNKRLNEAHFNLKHEAHFILKPVS